MGADNQYFIHYQGWNKKWDTWVHASLLMPEGLEAEKYALKLVDQERRRKEAREQAKRERSLGGDGAGGKGKRGGDGKGGSAKKPRVDYKRAIEVVDPNAPALKIPLPFTLKKQLVEDWEKCSQMDPQMLVPLPRKPCVADIVQSYLEFKTGRSNAAAQAKHQELFGGLVLYFDAALSKMLLYAVERHQFDAVVKAHPGLPASQIYGAEHLLRLFTKLPAALADAPMASVEASQLTASLGDFLKFLQKHSAKFLNVPYEVHTSALALENTPEDPTDKSGSAAVPEAAGAGAGGG